jgi:DNA-3-methyladenine glycosylase II
MYQVHGTLSAVTPFDFKQSLHFLDHFRIGQQSVEDSVLTRAFTVVGRVVVFRVWTEQALLAYTLFSDTPFTPEFQQTVAERIAFYLSLNDDLRPFYAIGQGDPPFAPIIQRLYGYHQVKFSMMPFENAVWAILSQRNMMSLSEKMRQAMVERYGSSLEVEGVVYRSFPEPAQLAGVPMDELAALIHHGPKAESILDAARAFSSMDEAFLREADYEDVYAWLRQIRGIGDWSAAFVLLRSLGRMEHFPRGEKRILQAASRVYNNGLELTSTEVEKLGERYGAWKGYWAHYLRAAG